MMCFNRNLKSVLLSGSSGLLLLFYFTGCDQQSTGSGTKWAGVTMGTTYQVQITQTDISENRHNQVVASVESTLVEVNRQMSTYDSKSEISRFNASTDTSAFNVSGEFAAVVKSALGMSERSGGAFDATVGPLVDLWGFGKKGSRPEPPSDSEIKKIRRIVGRHKIKVVGENQIKKLVPELELDLSAIAKGYGVDAVASVLRRFGFNNYMVEIGGEVAAAGLNAKREPWKIGVDKPALANLPGQALEAILALRDCAVATSGDYRNFFEYEGRIYSHTIDPATGWPVTHDLASVTVIARTCMEADALATSLMVLGVEKGLALIENYDGAEAFFITRDNDNVFEGYQSAGFNAYVYKGKE